MHRTQIYLGEDQYEMLKARARREGTTLAGVIRAILDADLKGGRLKGGDGARPDPFDGVVGSARGDGAAVAENHAEYLYGDKR